MEREIIDLLNKISKQIDPISQYCEFMMVEEFEKRRRCRNLPIMNHLVKEEDKNRYLDSAE